MTKMIFNFATVQGKNIQWFLRRNCAVTPSQLGWFYLSLCLMSAAIGSVFWLQGGAQIVLLAMLELLAVGAGFILYARHAKDGERIYLQGKRLVVEFENAGKVQRAEFQRESVRVEPKLLDRSLIELSGQGRSIHVGRFVSPELRPVLAREIRMALRGV